MWREELKNRINTLFELEKFINLTNSEKDAIKNSNRRMRMAITKHIISIIDKDNPDCPIRRQFIPTLSEFDFDDSEAQDPCGEERDTVVPGLVHRYPDRALLLLTDFCAVYCRHCTRKRIVGKKEKTLEKEELNNIYNYLKKNKKVRDVLISGGDPLLLSDEKLDDVLWNLRKIETIEIIRIGTRIPVVLPQRITKELCSVLKKYHPLYISVHFNHPKEISKETKTACEMLSDSGIPLGSQTVLLRGINNSKKVMGELVSELLKIRVRPYYLYQCDLAFGTAHFRTSIQDGIDIIESLRGFTTGYGVPTYVIDAPGGGGKVPVGPNYLISNTKDQVILKNWENRIYIYPADRSPNKKVAEKVAT